MDESKALDALTALANGTRLALVRLLVPAGREGLPQGEIARRLDISASRLAFHLGLLEQAGLVTARRESRNVLYSADPQGLGAVLSFILSDCCAGHPEIAHCCLHGRCTP
jgi:DNA-binding transcriptional ArsR family regulator